MSLNDVASRRGGSILGKLPATFWLGLAIIFACEIFLILDISWSNRSAIRGSADYATLTETTGPLHRLARWVAVNMTPLVWPGFVLLLEGILAAQRDSPARLRPNHFACLILTSVVIWCVFDWVNFYFIGAWTYLGMPTNFWDRAWGYFTSFACICPAMLMSGQVLLNGGWCDWAIARPFKLPKWAPFLVMVIGGAMFVWPFVTRDPIANYTLWTSFVFLLDPVNLWRGRPSFLRDWSNGWYGRTLAAFSGGLLCGLLWEFWNYWALAKWTYHLPFLGAAEEFRYFEMPVVGLLGFIPFGLECWVMWQTIRILMDGLVEPLPDARHLL